MVELGFIHGRFQLFHNDHLKYALLAKEQCKKMIYRASGVCVMIMRNDESTPPGGSVFLFLAISF